MEVSEDNSQKNNESTTQRLKPMWSPLFNLGLASLVGVIAAVAAYMSTRDLRDGGTLVAIPIGIAVWFLGDILRWRGRYPMRLFLMVPIFVALICTVSTRILQKANQRRIAWNSVIEAGASVKFDTVGTNGWLQYEEGIFVPAYLADCLKSIYLDFDLTEKDIESIALFQAEVELTLSPNINQKQQIEDAIWKRK